MKRKPTLLECQDTPYQIILWETPEITPELVIHISTQETRIKEKQSTAEEVILISDTDENITSIKSALVVIQPNKEVEEIPNSPEPEMAKNPYIQLNKDADNLIQKLKKEPVGATSWHQGGRSCQVQLFQQED